MCVCVCSCVVCNLCVLLHGVQLPNLLFVLSLCWSPCVSAISACASPATTPTGYADVAPTETDLSGPGFDVTNIQCAAGYAGTGMAHVCTTEGGEYTLSGCTGITLFVDFVLCASPDLGVLSSRAS